MGYRHWVFASEDRLSGYVSLILASDTKISRYVKIRGDANPFDPEWDEYFAKRQSLKEARSCSANVRRLRKV